MKEIQQFPAFARKMPFEIKQKETQHINVYEDDQLISRFHDIDSFLQNYSQLQDDLDKLKLELKKISSEEIQRIFREFDYKGYQQKYNVDKELLFSCIFGNKEAKILITKNALNIKQ